MYPWKIFTCYLCLSKTYIHVNGFWMQTCQHIQTQMYMYTCLSCRQGKAKLAGLICCFQNICLYVYWHHLVCQSVTRDITYEVQGINLPSAFIGLIFISVNIITTKWSCNLSIYALKSYVPYDWNSSCTFKF